MHLFIGADALNALSGICLRTIGFTQSVVLFAIDYTPRRFPNRLINFLYHTLNLVVARHCDFVWAVSGRIKRAFHEAYCTRCPIIIVPAGAHMPAVTPDPQISHNRLVFLGTLDRSKGLQLVIHAMPIIREQIPKVKLLVIGTGGYHDDLVKLANELGVQDAIEFVGHLLNHEKVMLMLTRCDIGLAPYVPDVTSISAYGAPFKIREYLIAGLPVIVTNVPEGVQEVSDRHAGIVVDYKVERLVNAIIHLLSNQALLQSYKENAIRLGQEYLWDKIFDSTLDETIKKLAE
ncbi:MAG: glycosyltransferase [Candidatus Bathyarchaeia archaeon]